MAWFELSGFKIYGRRHDVVSVFGRWVVEELYVFEGILPSGVAGRVGLTPEALELQQLEGALGDRFVVTVAAAARAGLDAVLAEQGLPFPAGELRALIGMYHHRAFWLVPATRTAVRTDAYRHSGKEAS